MMNRRANEMSPDNLRANLISGTAGFMFTLFGPKNDHRAMQLSLQGFGLAVSTFMNCMLSSNNNCSQATLGLLSYAIGAGIGMLTRPILDLMEPHNTSSPMANSM